MYRRYRPETFSEMIGQSQVTDPLMTALRTGRVGHAYLFSGPRGCGKTTSARILARCLNCAEGPTDTPCGTCPSCVELSRDGGGSLDVIEIDAASHGGVDDARDLRERAVFAPARDRFKIFIIDEAHMVTKEGFNALLKIVEEPPEHVKFVFATTEPDKVIGTIRSRTHHYPFRLIPPAALLDYVQTLCESEGVGVATGVLPLVVRAGGGSARDTLSILDQLIAGSEGDTVDYERAVGLLGFTHEDLLDEAVAAFGAHDAAAAFGAVDRVVQTGQDPQRFVEDLLERFRDLIVIGATNVDGAAAVFRGVPEDQLRRMFEQSQLFSHGELSRVADTIAAGLDRMRGATAPRLHLELMVARALVSADTVPATAAPAAAARQATPRPATGQAHAQDRGAAAPVAGTPTASPVRAAPAVQATPPAGPQSTSEQTTAAPSAPAPAAAASTEPVSFASAAAAARALLSEPPTPAAAPEPMPEPPEPERAEPEAAPPVPSGAEPDASEPERTEDEQAIRAHPASDVSSADSTAGPEGTIEQIRDAWAQILQSVLDANRVAWLASRAVNPLALLPGGMLGIAFDTQTERDVFLSGDAQPTLAAAIESVTGIAVRRYHPRGSRPGDLPRPATDADQVSSADLSVGAPPATPGASAPSDLAAPAAAPEDPSSSAVSSPSATVGGWPAVAGHGASSIGSAPAETQAVDTATSGGAEASPEAPAESVSAAQAPGTNTEFTGPDDLPEPPEPDEEPEPPFEAPEPPHAPEAPTAPETSVAAAASPAAPSQASSPASSTPASSTPAASAGPSFTRYGEAVVREVLGATFLEEVPRDGGMGR
nr:DNA polymerase III subunit gamma and tau [Leucobacter sp. cx-169]